jgi:inner membrane protein
MLLFGHIGITLGVATVLANFPSFRTRLSTNPRQQRFRLSPFHYLVDLIDVRLLMIGALLPDAIDKPLGHVIFPEILSNGRTYCHTLLFLILLFSLGTWIYKRSGRTWLLVLSFGIGLHLVLDQIWLTPRTFFWPFYSFTFDKGNISDWFSNMAHSLLINPGIFIPEVIGFVVLAGFIWWLVRRRKLLAFIWHGIYTTHSCE